MQAEGAISKTGLLALILATAALFFCWRLATQSPMRRPRPGSAFYDDAAMPAIDQADSLSQEYDQPEFGAGPPFVAEYDANGDRMLQHEAGW